MAIKLNEKDVEEHENSEEVCILINQSIMSSVTVFQIIKVTHACNKNGKQYRNVFIQK